MNLDQIDRDNLIRLVLAGRLSDLRAYAKDLLRITSARDRIKNSGRRPVADSLPSFTTRPLPEMVVLDQDAIDSARLILVERDHQSATDQRILHDSIQWLRDHIPAAPPEPVTHPGAICAPLSTGYNLSEQPYLSEQP